MNTSFAEKFLASYEEADLPEDISARFHILECINHNEFWETYLLSEKSSKTLFLLKCYHNTEIFANNEAKLLEGLEHTGLPSFFSVIEDGKKLIIIRKYIEGVTLNEFISEQASIDIPLTVDLLISLCDILIFLHSQPSPIIHRDIKPSNIIINPDSNAVSLIDFGISRKYSETADTDTVNFGTKKFAPPEQYGFAQTDCRTDIYAVGVVMRYWLTGTTDPKCSIQIRGLEKISAKCTELAPKLRYQNAAALKQALISYKNRIARRTIAVSSATLASCLILTGAVFLGGYNNAHDKNAVSENNATETAATTINTDRAIDTPLGYSGGDFQVLANFFSSNGNDDIIESLGLDITKPSTWNLEQSSESLTYINIEWNNETPKKVTKISLYSLDLAGDLDFSAFTELEWLWISSNNISSVNLSGCKELRVFLASENNLTNMDFSDNPKLEHISIWGNKISKLIFAENSELMQIECANNRLTDISVFCELENLCFLDFSNNSADLNNISSINAIERITTTVNSNKEKHLSDNIDSFNRGYGIYY